MKRLDPRKALIVAVAIALAGFVESKIDLLGMDQATGRLSDEVFQRLTVDARSPEGGTDGQREISVVSIDERVQDEVFAGRWPPGYDNLAYMVEDVVRAGGADDLGRPAAPPQAVFVDLLITGPGRGATAQEDAAFDMLIETVGRVSGAERWRSVPACLADDIIRLACMVAAHGTPVIFATADARDLAPTRAQRRLAEVAIMASVRIDLSATDLIETDRDGRPILTPAAALYLARCFRRMHDNASDACALEPAAAAYSAAVASLARGAPREPVWIAGLEQAWRLPISVEWGGRAAPGQGALDRATTAGLVPACRAEAAPWVRAYEALADRGPIQDDRRACPPILHMGYDRIVSGAGLSQADYRTLFSDRAVLIGGHFRSSSDWIHSPVHGQMPGVHLHAVMTQNLIDRGGDYRRAEGGPLKLDDLAKMVVTLVLVFASQLAVQAYGATRTGPLRMRDVVGTLGVLAAIALAALACGLVLAVMLRMYVVNWIGIALLVTGSLIATASDTPLARLAEVGPLGRVRRRLLGENDAPDVPLSPAVLSDPEPAKE